jgi:hypothetical protein
MDGLKRALLECLSSLKLTPVNETESIFDIPQDTIAAWKFDVDLSAMERAPTVTLPALHFLREFVDLCDDLEFWGTKLRYLFATEGG